MSMSVPTDLIPLTSQYPKRASCSFATAEKKDCLMLPFADVNLAAAEVVLIYGKRWIVEPLFNMDSDVLKNGNLLIGRLLVRIINV